MKAPTPLLQLQERCVAIGVPLWWKAFHDAHPGTLHGPTDSLLESAGLTVALEAEVERLLDPQVPAPADLVKVAPHVLALAFETRQGSMITGRGVALWRCATGENEATNQVAEQARGAPSPGEIERQATVLRWMLADLCGAATREHAISSFGYQLTEMYEEIGALYRIGQGMRGRSRPAEFVLATCRELAQTLPFRWVAAVFLMDQVQARVRSPLGGAFISTGDIPASRSEFEPLARDVLSVLKPSVWTLLQPKQNQLASLVGSQVLAHPVRRGDAVIGAMFAGNKTGADCEITSFETQLLDAAADFLGVFAENAHLDACQRALFIGTIEALSAAIDAKDRYTHGHSDRVALIASSLAIRVGMSADQIERVRLAGLLHDVGKIGVPEAVLTKRGRLTDEEFSLIRQHPEIGHRILADIPSLDDILPGVLYHHERIDGRGYPHALAGEQVPLLARILAVADAFDAMSSNRSYRSAMPRERVLEEVRRGAGTQFDASVADAFLTLDFTEYDAQVARHKAADVRAAA